MGNSNRRETTKKEDEEEDDLVKVGEEEPGESGGKDDSKDCSGRVEVKGRGLLDESLINIFFYENYFKNFFNLHEINKYVFTANSTKGGYEIEGGGEDKEDTSEETSKIRNNKKIEEMTLYNNRYIVNFLDDTIKSKIEIANFISFYFFFQSVKNKGVTDSVRRKDLSDINYIYRKVRKSKRYIASNQMHTCIRNYLYHIDRRKFPIWNDSVGCERSSGKDVLKNVGVGEIAEEVRRRSDMGDSDTLKEMEPQRSLKGILREVKKGQSGKTKGEGCPSKWKKNVPHRVKIEEDKVTFRRKSTLGRKYEEAFSLYNTGKNYRRARRGGMGDVEGKRKDREEPGEKEKLEEEPEDDAHLRGHVDGIQLSKDGHVSGNGLDTPLKSEMGKRKSDNSSYAVYIKKTLSKVFNRYEINRYGLVRKKKKKGNVFLGHLLKEQMNMGISFSPAGLLIPYHLGVSSLLIEKNILNIHTSIAGSSAGSICACCLGIGLSVDKCFFLIENIISNVYKNGCYQKLQNMLNVELNKYLYAGSYNFLNRRNGSVFVGVTQILPYYKRLNITRFYDDSDLINAVIASCNIPMYLSNNIFVNFRNKKCIDGLFSTKKKDFGCPNTKTDRIVKVSPFDSDYVGIENKNNSVISPHMVKYRHLIFLFLCVKNLFHRVVDNVWVEKDYAFLIQRLKRIMDLRIFSWGEFLRDYFCTPGGGGALITVSMDRGTDVGDSGGLEIPCEAGSSELIHRLEVKLNRFRCTRGNASAKEIFLRVNREALAQFDRHNCKYTNFYNFSVTLINVMSAYFEENFFPSRRLKGVVLGVLRADGEGTAGEANGEANGATNGEKNREKNREKNGEDAELESIYLLLEKEKLLRMEEYIRFHPKLESEVILFFFKEHFANESILRLEKRFLKRSIHELVDALKDICFVDCVERCVRRLVCFSRNAEKDDGKSVLSGSRGEPLAGEFQPRVRAITHYLKHIQIYKNFIYILNEIKAANGRVVKVSEHNYYTFMCLNGEDINDSYLFLYLYLYANLCHRVLFARTEGGKDGVGRGNNCLCGLSGSKARGRMSPPTEGNNCGEGTPGGYIPRGDNHLEEHMMQKKDSVANLSDESRAVSLTKRFTELWSVRRRSGEIETLDEEKEKYKMQNSTENCHASHVDLFMRKREELEVGGEPQLNCSDKNKFEKGLPEVLKNLLLFNHDCGFINRVDEFGGSAMLSSVDKFILYVNGRAFNMFELCNFVYVCLGGGVGSLGSVAGGEGSSQMNLVQAVGDVGDVGEELTRDAFRRKWSSGYTVHVDRGGEGKKLKAKREPTEEQEDEDSASGTTLAKRERQQIPEGTLAHHHLEDAQGVDGKVCHEHQSSRKCKRGSEYLKGKGKGKGKEKEERSGNCQIRNPSGDEKENQAHRSRNTGRVMRGFHPNRVSKTKQKKGNQRDGKERKPRSISLPIDLHKTVLKMRHLRGKIKLNENIIDGINREILIGTPYEHIYTHSNFWIYSSSDESDGRNPCDNGFYLNSGDATDSCFDSVFDDLLDEADGFSKISSFFRTFRNMDGNLGLSGYFGF
eukprot:XP_002257849.1 hypothetical protein, conserved in Plasmodium species [Plasmodium knowlesi strain H]